MPNPPLPSNVLGLKQYIQKQPYYLGHRLPANIPMLKEYIRIQESDLSPEAKEEALHVRCGIHPESNLIALATSRLRNIIRFNYPELIESTRLFTAPSKLAAAIIQFRETKLSQLRGSASSSSTSSSSSSSSSPPPPDFTVLSRPLPAEPPVMPSQEEIDQYVENYVLENVRADVSDEYIRQGMERIGIPPKEPVYEEVIAPYPYSDGRQVYYGGKYYSGSYGDILTSITGIYHSPYTRIHDYNNFINNKRVSAWSAAQAKYQTDLAAYNAKKASLEAEARQHELSLIRSAESEARRGIEAIATANSLYNSEILARVKKKEHFDEFAQGVYEETMKAPMGFRKQVAEALYNVGHYLSSRDTGTIVLRSRDAEANISKLEYRARLRNVLQSPPPLGDINKLMAFNTAIRTGNFKVPLEIVTRQPAPKGENILVRKRLERSIPELLPQDFAFKEENQQLYVEAAKSQEQAISDLLRGFVDKPEGWGKRFNPHSREVLKVVSDTSGCSEQTIISASLDSDEITSVLRQVSDRMNAEMESRERRVDNSRYLEPYQQEIQTLRDWDRSKPFPYKEYAALKAQAARYAEDVEDESFDSSRRVHHLDYDFMPVREVDGKPVYSTHKQRTLEKRDADLIQLQEMITGEVFRPASPVQFVIDQTNRTIHVPRRDYEKVKQYTGTDLKLFEPKAINPYDGLTFDMEDEEDLRHVAEDYDRQSREANAVDIATRIDQAQTFIYEQQKGGGAEIDIDISEEALQERALSRVVPSEETKTLSLVYRNGKLRLPGSATSSSSATTTSSSSSATAIVTEIPAVYSPGKFIDNVFSQKTTQKNIKNKLRVIEEIDIDEPVVTEVDHRDLNALQLRRMADEDNDMLSGFLVRRIRNVG